MSAPLATIVDRPGVRVALLGSIFAGTVLLGPWAALGAWLGANAYLSGDASIPTDSRWLFLVGSGGLLGLVGAWIRMLCGAEVLRSRK
jgi:hypothetical protein